MRLKRLGVARPSLRLKSIDWIIDSLDKSRDKQIRQRGSRNPKKVPVDERVYACSCGVCWEEVWTDAIKRINYYKDFPTLGKVRKECPKCR